MQNSFEFSIDIIFFIIMRICRFFIFFLLIYGCTAVSGQQTLPAISAKNINGKIILSWVNGYKKTVQNIMIQRSYDSLKNYSTIGTVLNPSSVENGYPDINPPYDRMFYRVAITFEGGTYEIGLPSRPVKEIKEPEELDITAFPKIITEKEDETGFIEPHKKEAMKPIVKTTDKKEKSIIVDSAFLNNKPVLPKKIIETIYPSNRIFTSKQNVVVIHLSDYNLKKYSIRFFDENEKQVLEIKKINDEYLYIEKYNFFHSGWFRFEIYENGEIFEKNKVFISKDKPKQTG